MPSRRSISATMALSSGQPPVEQAVQKMGRDLGVGLAREPGAPGGEILPERAEVLDDAVVHDRDAARDVGMGVGLRGRAVGRPACVADARTAPGRGGLAELVLEIDELAPGAPPVDGAVDQRRDAGGVVAPVFQPAQAVDEEPRRVGMADDPDDAAHGSVFPSRRRAVAAALRLRMSDAMPCRVTCLERPTESASASTSWVTVLPAPTMAPSPTRTGATSAVFEPMKAPAPMSVRCLRAPS